MSTVEIGIENNTNLEILRKFKDKEGFFMKAFFVDDTFNENDWGVTPDALTRDLRTGLETTYFGKTAPVIMMEPFFGHPEPDEQKGETMIVVQEEFRVGNFLDVDISPNGRAFFVAEIFNKRAQELLETREIIFISPSLRALEHIHIGFREVITKFRVNHAALVKQPAFGLKAQIRGICKGKGGDCLKSFQDINASKNFQGAITSNDILFLEEEKDRIIVFRTQKDAKVDDEICRPLDGKKFDIAFNTFPRIPEDTHPNCRCMFIQESTGKIVSDISGDFQAKSNNHKTNSKSMSGKSWKGAVKEGENFKIAVCDNTGNMVIELEAQSPLNKIVKECLSKKLKPGEKPTDQDLAICFSEARGKLAKAESLKTNPINHKSKSKMSGQQEEEEKMEEQIAQMDDEEKKKFIMDALKAKAKSASEHNDETEDEKKSRVAQEEKDEKEKREGNKRAKANQDEIDKLKEDQAELKSTIDDEIKEPIAEKIATYKVSVNKIKSENKQAEINKLMKKSVPELKELHSDYSAIADFKKNSLNDVPPGYQPRYDNEFSASLKDNEGKDMLSDIRSRMGAR